MSFEIIQHIFCVLKCVWLPDDKEEVNDTSENVNSVFTEQFERCLFLWDWIITSFAFNDVSSWVFGRCSAFTHTRNFSPVRQRGRQKRRRKWLFQKHLSHTCTFSLLLLIYRMPAYNASTGFAIFFILYILINTYIFMSVFLAVVYNNYKKYLKVRRRALSAHWAVRFWTLYTDLKTLASLANIKETAGNQIKNCEALFHTCGPRDRSGSSVTCSQFSSE